MAIDNKTNLITTLSKFTKPSSLVSSWKDSYSLGSYIQTGPNANISNKSGSFDYSAPNNDDEFWWGISDTKHKDGNGEFNRDKIIKIKPSSYVTYGDTSEEPLTELYLIGQIAAKPGNDKPNSTTVLTYSNSYYTITNACSGSQSLTAYISGLNPDGTWPDYLTKEYQIKVTAKSNVDLRNTEISVKFRLAADDGNSDKKLYKVRNCRFKWSVTKIKCQNERVARSIYTFSHWAKYDKPFISNPQEGIPKFYEGNTYPGTESGITLYNYKAVYNRDFKIKYTIKFHINSTSTQAYSVGNTSGTMADQTMYFDKPANINACQFSVPQYRFMGWATSAEGNVVYSNKQRIENSPGKEMTSTANGVIHLYAVWKYYVHVDIANLSWNSNGCGARNNAPGNGWIYGRADNFIPTAVSDYFSGNNLTSIKKVLKTGTISSIRLYIHFHAELKKYGNYHVGFALWGNDLNCPGNNTTYPGGHGYGGVEWKTTEKYSDYFNTGFSPTKSDTTLVTSKVRWRTDFYVNNGGSAISNVGNILTLTITGMTVWDENS